jgi:hypothetical protein
MQGYNTKNRREHGAESVPETIVKNRHLGAVFPLLLSLLASSISPPAVLLFHSELLDMSLPEISRDYFPSSPLSILVDSKPKFQVPLWHDHLCSKYLLRTQQPNYLFSSPKVVPTSAISGVALGTVLRC